MRIDKFLWCLRYFKTRTISSNATKKGQVRVNDSIVKPSREVYPTDEINVRINQVNYRMTVLDLPKSRVGAKLVDQYRQDTTSKSEFEAKELLKLAKEHYRKKGEGRPTKKDRRDIEGYLDFGKN